MVSTHRRTGTSGKTRSTRCAARCRPQQDARMALASFFQPVTHLGDDLKGFQMQALNSVIGIRSVGARM